MITQRIWECDWCHQRFQLPDQAPQMLEEIQTCPSNQCPEQNKPLEWLQTLSRKVQDGLHGSTCPLPITSSSASKPHLSEVRMNNLEFYHRRVKFKTK